jgi:hypothetical protein
LSNLTIVRPGRLEKAVAGLEKTRRLALFMEVETSRRHHADGRDRMTMQSGRLPRRKSDARAFDQTDGGVGGG